MIDQQTIGKIIEASQILEVVQDFMSLRRRGANYIGCCPFHNEKTPSFSVSPAKNIFKCFGCGVSGSPISFVMKHENMTYPEALKYLAKKFNIPVVEKELSLEQKQEHEDRESMNIVNDVARKFFQQNLLETEEGKTIAMPYFKERGFSKETIEKFQLGYSPSNRQALVNFAKEKGYKLKYLEKTGLIITKEDGYSFDRFTQRVMFPIQSISGQVIAFGGRIMTNDKKQAKYVNSPESEVYHKSNSLYGIYQAKNMIIRKDKCYLVEGYADVISMHQAGIENTVASSGTSLTPGQVMVIKRFTSNLTVIYDGDSAGIKASLRGIDLILEQDINVKVVLLPKDEDPDSFARSHTPSDVEKYIEDHQEDFIKFKTRILLGDTVNDPIERSKAVQSIVESISKISNAVTRSVYIKECAQSLNVKEDALYAETGRILKKHHEDEAKQKYRQAQMAINQANQSSSQANDNENSPLPPDDFGMPEDMMAELGVIPQAQTERLPSFVDNIYAEIEEKELISYLINYGNQEFEKYLDEFGNVTQSVSVATYIIGELLNEELVLKNLVYQKVFEDYKNHLLEEKELPTEYFLNNSDETIRNLAGELTIPKNTLSNIWTKRGNYCETPDDTFKKDIPKTIISYKLKIMQIAIKQTMELLKNKALSPEDVKEIMDNLKILYNARNSLASNLNRLIF